METTAENTNSMNHTTPADSAGDTAKETAAGAAVGAGVGIGFWGLAMPVANAIGFGVNGIAAGSTAASMMSAAAVANGGGVAAGGTVAALQSIGAVGLATPVGLGLVAGGLIVGGAAVGIKSLFSKRNSVVEGEEETPQELNEEMKDKEGAKMNETPSWLLLEWLSAVTDPVQTRFASECEARDAFKNSFTTKKMLFSADMTCVESSG